MKISIDKLKLCYTLYEDSPLYQLMETPLEIYELPHWDFRLERTEGKYYDYIYKIIYLERTSNNPNSEYDMQCFGTLRWGLKADREGEMSGFVWIEMENKQLYLNYNYNIHNRLVYLEYIEGMLGLKFHNLTRLDLAFDDTHNLSKRLIRAIRDEALIPIVNGTKITDRDKLLEDILYSTLVLVLAVELRNTASSFSRRMAIYAYQHTTRNEKSKAIVANSISQKPMATPTTFFV